MTAESVLERVVKAVCSLAESAKPIQDRLYSTAIDLSPLRAKDFPGDLRPSFEEAMRDLNANGTYKKTAYAVSDDEAEKIAQKITGLLTGLVYLHASFNSDH